MYRLIAFDIDGTLVDASLRLSPRLLSAAAQARAAGVALTLATGRGVVPILPLAAALGVDAPLVCYQGGCIYDTASQRTLYRAVLPAALARSLTAWALPQGWEISVYIEGHILMHNPHRPAEFYDRWFGLPWRSVADLTAAIVQDPEKLLFTGDPAQCDLIHAQLNARFGADAQVLRTHDFFVEVTPLGTSKGQALAWIANRLGIAREEVIAVGDSENDVSMVQWAGLGVAMGNATPQVKAAARWQAPTVQEDGAAVVIERFILGGSQGLDGHARDDHQGAPTHPPHQRLS